jgi:hypothetical protein
MKKVNYLIVLMACTMAITPMFGQLQKKNKIVLIARCSKVEFIKTDPMKGFFDKAYGYVIFQCG